MMIPSEKIDEIRERADIVQIVSEYIPLKKSGRNHVGLCPFHSEKTPSFTVNDEKQIFYCFGCGAGGNAFTFLMKQENLSFPEAVRTIAKRLGIEIPMDKKPSAEENQRELLFLANHIAAEYYHQNLLTSPEAEKAQVYIKNRGLKPEITKNFKIGYASQISNSLAKFLTKKGISLDLAEKVGLVAKRGNDYYDRFRNRIMFPIMDVRNRVVGFGGRALGNEEPKYLNSPTSPLFKKGESLYGMFQAKNAASKEGFVLVVEGYIDLLMLHQHNFINTVATLGTALTTEHLRRLKGYTKEVYTLFDSDEAGKAAAIRSLPMFLEEDIHSKVVLIPAGLDPDELLKKEGAAKMAEYIHNAKPSMDFFLDSIKTKYDIESSNGKVSFLEQAAPYVVNIKNPTERDVYIERISSILHIRPDVVLSSIRIAKPLLSAISAKEKTETKDWQNRHIPTAHEILNKGISTKGEETILKILLSYPKLYDRSIDSIVEMFQIDFLKEAGGLIINALKNEKGEVNISSIAETAVDERVKKWLLKNSVEDDSSIKMEPEKILEDCCKKILVENKFKQERALLLKKLAEAEKTGDNDSFKVLAKSYLSHKRSI